MTSRTRVLFVNGDGDDGRKHHSAPDVAWRTDPRFGVATNSSEDGSRGIMTDLDRHVPFEVYENSVPATDPAPLGAVARQVNRLDHTACSATRPQIYVVGTFIREGCVQLLMERHGAAVSAGRCGDRGCVAPVLERIGPRDVNLPDLFYIDTRRRATRLLDLVSGNLVHATRLPYRNNAHTCAAT